MTTDPLPSQQMASLVEALGKLRSQLEDQARIIESSTRPVTLDQQAVGRVSRVDALAQQAMNTARKQQGAERLRAVILALARVESGDYGYCVECDKAIAYARLEACPETALCIICQELSESRR